MILWPLIVGLVGGVVAAAVFDVWWSDYKYQLFLDSWV